MFRPTERKKVQWSPHNANQFVVGSNDLRLYEIRSSVRIFRCNSTLLLILCSLSNSFACAPLFLGFLCRSFKRCPQALFCPPTEWYEPIHSSRSHFFILSISDTQTYLISLLCVPLLHLDVKPHEKKVITLVGAHTEIQSLKVRAARFFSSLARVFCNCIVLTLLSCF